jgi:hypothetical protein
MDGHTCIPHSTPAALSRALRVLNAFAEALSGDDELSCADSDHLLHILEHAGEVLTASLAQWS